MSAESRKKELSLLVPPGAPPPYDPDAEEGMLHIAMTFSSLAEEMVAIVRPEDLYEEPHRRLWAAICELVKEGKLPNVLNVKARIRTKKESNLVDASIFEKISRCGASESCAMDYCRTVAGKARMYRILTALHQCVAEGYCGTMDAEEFAQAVASRVESVTGLGVGDEAPRWLFDVAKEQVVAIQKNNNKDTPLMVTGLTKLDERLIMREGQLVIVAGRPGMGKSAFAGQAALATGNTLFVSLEMPNGDLGRRSIAARVGMPFTTAFERTHTTEMISRLGVAFKDIQRSGVQVVDQPSVTLAQVASYCRHTSRELEKAGFGKLRAVVVDYLQLMTDPEVARKGNREAEIASISRGLKALAKRMKITVMALSQLSREAEAKEGGRPQLKHLRESGAIEQDADKIIFPYRQNYYDKKDLGDVEPCEIIIAKDRQNGPGMVQVGWRGSATVFEDLADEEVTPNW